MKRKELILTAVVMPLAIGLILSIVFVMIAKPSISKVLPIDEGTAFAYHDNLDSNSETVSQDVDIADLKANDVIGTVKILGNDMNIKYNCDYSNTINSLSFNQQNCRFGDIGCVYLETNHNSAKIIEGESELDIESVFGTYKYQLVEQYKADNEFKILSSVPNYSKAMVIYYQNTNGAGLSSSYTALVYQEVA